MSVIGDHDLHRGFAQVARPRLLVIGGTGRLGRLLQRAFATPSGAGVQPVWQTRGAPGPGTWLRVDPLTEPDALAAAAARADVILHLAGAVSGGPEGLARHTDLALATVRAAGGRPVFVASSAAVYGAGPPPDPERGWSEADPCRPASRYGAAKCAMEQAVAGCPGVTVLRIGNVAGADALFGHAAPDGGRVLDCFADGSTPRRSYIGPRALTRALARLTRIAGAGGVLPQTLNLALPGVVSMDGLLDAAGARWQIRPAPGGAIAEVRLDVSRAVGLGLIPAAPARAPMIVGDLRGLEARASAPEAQRAEHVA